MNGEHTLSPEVTAQPEMEKVFVTAAAATRTTRIRRLCLAAVMLYIVIKALPSLGYPMTHDHAIYSLIGQGLLQGQKLYRDMWDNKPPGIFLIFAAVVKVFGPVVWSVGVIDFFWLLVMAYFIFRFTERYLGTAAAVIAVLLSAEWHVDDRYNAAAQPEAFILLFVFAGFFLAAREGRWVSFRHYAAGLLFGGVFWLKYNALIFLPVFYLLPYLDTSRMDDEPRRIGLRIPLRDWFRRAGYLTAGFATAVILVLADFWLSGAWAAFKEVQLVVLPRYGAMAYAKTPHFFLWALEQTQIWIGFWTECAALAALWIANRKRELSRLTPVMMAAAAGYICAASQMRFHHYYLETSHPFVAMIWGYVAVKAYEGVRDVAHHCAQRGWRLARVLVWVLFASFVAYPIPGEVVELEAHYQSLRTWWSLGVPSYATYPWQDPISNYADVLHVSQDLRKTLRPEDTMYVWGRDAHLYLFAGRRPPNRFVTNLALVSPWAPPEWRGELMRFLEASPPRFIVVDRRDQVPFITYKNLDSEQFLQTFPQLNRFISDRYQRTKNLSYLVVYERQALSEAKGPH